MIKHVKVNELFRFINFKKISKKSVKIYLGDFQGFFYVLYRHHFKKVILVIG